MYMYKQSVIVISSSHISFTYSYEYVKSNIELTGMVKNVMSFFQEFFGKQETDMLWNAR